jgi:hypothetical protein
MHMRDDKVITNFLDWRETVRVKWEVWGSSGSWRAKSLISRDKRASLSKGRLTEWEVLCSLRKLWLSTTDDELKWKPFVTFHS